MPHKHAKDVRIHFTGEDIQMANNSMKRCLTLGKSILKPQWGTTKYLLKWLKLKTNHIKSGKECGCRKNGTLIQC